MIYVFAAVNIANLLLIIYCIIGAVTGVWPTSAWVYGTALIFAVLVKIWNVYTIKNLKLKG